FRPRLKVASSGSRAPFALTGSKNAPPVLVRMPLSRVRRGSYIGLVRRRTPGFPGAVSPHLKPEDR
ncbi:hypothetical protein LLE87_27680, partial [Paenibacillus polymyxa]|nr:hypothetical protein [Paenibacillus polymyxa]